MIAYVKGKLVQKEPTFVVLEANGIGYHINISLSTYSQIKEEENCILHTHFHVKEDAQTLFGFSSLEEKKVFLHLISISGVGPSTGLMVVSSMSPGEIQSAIVNGDAKSIQMVKGIGAKTAQRIVLELKDKMAKEQYEVQGDGIKNVVLGNTVKNEALSALMTLGFAKASAEKSIDKILKNSGNSITLEELIKQALKSA